MMSDRLLTSKEIESVVGLSRTAIYRMEIRGDFPKRVKIGARKIGWYESEVNDWLARRERARLGDDAA